MTQNTIETFDELLNSPRWPEVVEYANRGGLSYERAVVVLVNKGLSHIDPPWQQTHVEPYRRPGPR